MEELGQLQQVRVLYPHFLADAVEAAAPGFQVGDPDDVVIGHCVGDVFRRLTRQDPALCCAVAGHDRSQMVKIGRAIAQVLKVHDLAQSGQGEVGYSGGHRADLRGQPVPFGQQPGRARDCGR